VRADDGAARDAGEDFDAAQHVKLGEAGQHPDVEERGAEAAARKPQPDAPVEGAAHGGRPPEEVRQRAPGGGAFKLADLDARGRLEPRQRGELPDG
jgi:hypothetical protein